MFNNGEGLTHDLKIDQHNPFANLAFQEWTQDLVTYHQKLSKS